MKVKLATNPPTTVRLSSKSNDKTIAATIKRKQKQLDKAKKAK